MNRIVTSAALALSLLASSAVALAGGGKAEHKRGDRAAFEAQFPMAGATFQQKATERGQKAQQHLEKKLSEKQVPADKAGEIRAKFAATQAKVQAKVTEVAADGTVTLDEAKAVMAVAREGRPEHRGGHGKTARQGQKLA
ncbi:MAG: hypothetical protein EOO72_10925 [Myxococcaceae bacterium]|nr:MAG: hypothetical protein EOO72_10925 [Myxococcaceae bacterium]